MASRIRVFTSALYMTTSGVVGGGDGVLVIDPAILPREIEAIRWYVEQSDKPAKFVLYTHHHWDHVLGGQAFPSARRLAHRRFPAALEAAHSVDEARRFFDRNYIAHDPPFEFQPPHDLVDDGWTGDVGDLEFRLIHLPGHATDALGVYIPSEKTLFAADMASDVELPMIEGDGSEYLASLVKIEALVGSGQVETLVPGHGHVMRSAKVIRAILAHDVRYIEQLREILGALNAGADDAAAIEACRSMDYRGKAGSPPTATPVPLSQAEASIQFQAQAIGGWPPMVKVHEVNVKTVYAAMKQRIASRNG
jgi:glyoxylase-like metal-dependent hydrolase (beta-lactamase superfamily II)